MCWEAPRRGSPREEAEAARDTALVSSLPIYGNIDRSADIVPEYSGVILTPTLARDELQLLHSDQL